jgi:O-antigen ligase
MAELGTTNVAPRSEALASRPGVPHTVAWRADVSAFIERWLPQSFVEWIWWPLFLVWAFLPATRTPVVRIAGVETTLKEALLASSALFTVPWIIRHRIRYARAFRWSYLPFSLLVVFALSSMFLTGNYRHPYAEYIALPAFLAWCAMSLAFALVCSLPPDKIEGLAYRLSTAIAIIALVYIYVTLFPPGDYRRFARVSETFGLTRLAGPLGLSMSLPAVMVPALAYFASESRGRTYSPFALLMTLILTGVILLGGSRAGFLALLVVVLSTFLGRLSVLARVFLGASIVGVTVLVFQLVSAERYLDFQDNIRMETYTTAVRAWTDSAFSLIFGQGYGSIWEHWYLVETELVTRQEIRPLMFHMTDFGRVVTIPHSTYFQILAELGLLGIGLLAIAIGSQLIPVYRRNMTYGPGLRLAPGMAASLIVLLFDTILFKTFRLASIWWVFFFIMAADVSMQAKSAARQPSAPAKSRPGQPLGARDLRAGRFRPKPA